MIGFGFGYVRNGKEGRSFLIIVYFLCGFEQFYITHPRCRSLPAVDTTMPRSGSIGSAIDKTLSYIRKVHKNEEVALKFTNYASKNCIIYKLNKYHYLDNELYVIDMHAFQEMARLFKTSNYVELVHLDLCNVGDEEIFQFCKGNWDSVRFLSLSSNKLRKRGIEALVKGRFCELKELSLSDNGLDASSVEPLGKAIWKKLEKLNLNFNYLGSSGLAILEGSKWRTLKVLSLLSNAIPNSGIASLVRMDFPYLQQLQLSHNQLTDDSTKVLIKGHWPQLKALQLDDNFIGDSGLKHLSKLGCYKLQKLHIFDGKTVIINNRMDPKVLPTIGGLKELACGNFERLRVEIHLGKLGEVSKARFIRSAQLRDMLENRNIDIALLSKSNN